MIIEDCFCNVKSRKSPGIDGLTGSMCKNIRNDICEYLEVIIGSNLAGLDPEDMEISSHVAILKSSDRVRCTPGSYRGISHLLVSGKVLNRIMVYRIREYYSVGLSCRQFGFREGMSTYTTVATC